MYSRQSGRLSAQADKGGNNVDITVDMDTNVDMGEQETEMP